MNTKNKEIWKGPTPLWNEGLMLGNGNFGALLFGEQEIEIALDLMGLWDRRPSPEMEEKGFSYPHLVESAQKDWNEYQRLFDRSYNHPYPSKINGGSLLIPWAWKESSKAELDVATATAFLAFGEHQLCIYLDHYADVLVLHGKEKIPFSFKMPAYLSSEDPEHGLGYPEAQQKEEGGFRILLQKTTTSFYYGILIYQKNKSSYVTLFKGMDGQENAIRKAKNLLRAYAAEASSHYRKHCSYWRSYFKTSSLSTGEALLDRLYLLSRYFFACNSGKTYPASLQGVWTSAAGHLPPWKGDYHLDINLEMEYESYLQNGNFAEGRTLVDYLWAKRKAFASLAKDFYHVPGLMIPGVMTPDGAPLGGWPMYAFDPANAIWISKAFDEYYRYFGGISFLKARAYPFFKELEKGIRGLLVEKDGSLQFPLAASPEMNDDTPQALFSHATNFELSLLHYLYRTLIQYCALLGKSPRDYQAIEKRIHPYYRDEKGETLIAEAYPYAVSHRHFSHLLMENNLGEITVLNGRDQLERDFAHLESYGTLEWAGFSFTEASQFASYLGDGEKAFRYAEIFASAFVGPHGFHQNMDVAKQGYSSLQSNAFTLEANSGFIKSINNLFLISLGDILWIFPGLSKEMAEKGASFRSLRGEGNVRVSGDVHEGTITFSIHPAQPKTIRLLNTMEENPSFLVDGKKISTNAKKGGVISLFCKKEILYQP